MKHFTIFAIYAEDGLPVMEVLSDCAHQTHDEAVEACRSYCSEIHRHWDALLIVPDGSSEMTVLLPGELEKWKR